MVWRRRETHDDSTTITMDEVQQALLMLTLVNPEGETSQGTVWTDKSKALIYKLRGAKDSLWIEYR